MRLFYQVVSSMIFLALTVTLAACASGSDKATQTDVLTSPARLLDQGVQNYNNHHYQDAIRYFEKSLLQYRSIDDQPGIANSCLNLGKAHMAINNNQTASEYLNKATSVIELAQLTQLKEHLHLLKSSLAINNTLYDEAIVELKPLLNSNTVNIKLAALKNRTRIAFIKKDSDRQQWLNQYKTLQQQNPENTLSHQARILRFESETTEDNKEKTALLQQSLALSKKISNRTAIAATLTQWAKFDFKNRQYQQSEDKNLRALFIRHQSGDVKNTLLILKQLQAVYIATNNEKEKLTNTWINKLSEQQLSGWQSLFSDFDNFPNPN